MSARAIARSREILTEHSVENVFAKELSVAELLGELVGVGLGEGALQSSHIVADGFLEASEGIILIHYGGTNDADRISETGISGHVDVFIDSVDCCGKCE